MIYKQCATMLDAILVEHVSAHVFGRTCYNCATMLLQCMYNKQKHFP